MIRKLKETITLGALLTGLLTTHSMVLGDDTIICRKLVDGLAVQSYEQGRASLAAGLERIC
jgi:hypothetical protein